MGYSVDTNGRVLLPEALEGDALAGLREDLAAHDGWYRPDDPQSPPVRSLADLATFVGATVERDGEWLRLTTDRAGDAKWSEQATAFYLGLARWVRQGQVQVYGEDGQQWSYRYASDGVTQLGTNGWDGSTPAPPAGDDSGTQTPAFTYPGQDLRITPPGPAGPAPGPQPPSPPPSPDWPPEGGGRPEPPATDEPPPASSARRFAMAALLVVGVLLIVGLALVASGL